MFEVKFDEYLATGNSYPSTVAEKSDYSRDLSFIKLDIMFN